MNMLEKKGIGRQKGRRWRPVPFLCLLLACMITAGMLSACSVSSGGTGSGTYQIYYTNAEGDRLIHQSFRPDSQNFEGILQEMLSQFGSSPNTGVVSTMPDFVKINSSSIGISEIDVDFDSGYLSLGKVQELLLRCALVETLTQLPGVDAVRVTVDGQPLSVDGNEIGAMTADSFIVPEEDVINTYRTLEIPLYFSSRDGENLVRENRKIYYSSNINTERIVAEQVISGPNSDSLLPVTTSSVIVLGARIRRSTCLIDFSSAVNDLPAPDSPVQPETALYAFVNSIIDACGQEGVSGVRFTIEGQSDERFRGQVNLDQTFPRNDDIVQISGSSSEEAGVIVDNGLTAQEDAAQASTES